MGDAQTKHIRPMPIAQHIRSVILYILAVIKDIAHFGLAAYVLSRVCVELIFIEPLYVRL